MTAVSVVELQRAWAAVAAGRFRAQDPLLPPGELRPGRGEGTSASWDPGHPVLPVLGAHGGAGATTTALALATAAGTARVVEAASISASGLAGAATAELGEVEDRWLRGNRDQVVLDRLGQVFATPSEVPVPADAPGVDLTVLDAGWETSSIYLSDGWLVDWVYPRQGRAVLVARATVPGMRHLEGALHLLDGCDPVAAVISPARRWPVSVRAATGARTRQLDEDGALVRLPHDQGLAIAGLDTTPLPRSLLAGAAQILQLIGLEVPTTHPKKGSLR